MKTDEAAEDKMNVSEQIEECHCSMGTHCEIIKSLQAKVVDLKRRLTAISMVKESTFVPSVVANTYANAVRKTSWEPNAEAI